MIVSSWHNYMMKVSKSSRKSYLKEKQSTNVFVWIIKEFCGLNFVLLYPRITNLENKFLMRHIYRSFLFIPVVPRCTRTLNKISGGLERKERSLNMFLSVMSVKELSKFHP